MQARSRRWLAAIAVAAAVLGCVGTLETGGDNPRSSALPAPPDPVDNPTTPAKAALGKKLFFDPRLSGDGSMACQGCHYRHLGWTDGLPLSRKVGGGMNTRHTPSVYNTGYYTSWYWDGRAKTLEGQVTAAWKAQIGADPVRAAAVIAAVPAYQAEFQAAFGVAPNAENTAQALAAFLRTLNSGESPWDRYTAGDRTAVSADAVAGYELFNGKAGCAGCHKPPLFSDGQFHNIGLEAGKANPDPGRFAVTKDPADLSAFKTPSLRSVAISGPYFHDGSVGSLDVAVRYMASGGKADPNKSGLLVDRKLADREIAQLLAFLETLTSHERFEPPKVP
ncbi:cytochrome c peroxidase [Accumulibacter sp.]|jgi:cytochrome c peroxidase|uniref:cytochrome-c peroxidase n=1 Tax=Accumulibacter sp. TaxID=2053492 RepID=UPI001AD3EA55|nr:cytochrome c peroxidase [Accumulibacter sp.]MBN8452202.1 c-type cytochrome [Accumulibacter sp.]